MSTRSSARSGPPSSRPTSRSGWCALFTDAVRARCVGLELVQNLSPGQQVIKIVNEELVRILGGETLKVTYAGRPPTVILLAGLQGSGKTTTSAKLARWFKQQGRNPLLVGADLQRPAAVEQLQILGAQAGITVFSEPSDPVAVAVAGLEEADVWVVTCSSSTPPDGCPSTRT